MFQSGSAPNTNIKPVESETDRATPFDKNNFSFCLASERYLTANNMASKPTTAKQETNKNGNGSSSSTEELASTPQPRIPSLVKLCNYCGLKGYLRCTQCKQTYYCSVTCQRADWKVHRHLCKPATQGNNSSENPVTPVGCRHKDSELKISPSQQKRVYLSDLQKMDVRKGSKVQACVMEFKDPGNFFIQIQTVEIMESLRKVTLDLQNTYANSGNHTPYLPEKGEVCAAKYSQDQNWYRCLVWSLDPTIKTANVFYIDFGNEEEVNLGSIKPLSVNIDPIAPCALQCQVAAVAAPFNVWSEECCIAVKRLLPMKSSLVTVVDLLEDNTVFAVDFTLTAIGKQLGEFLLEQGYAVEPNDGKNSPREQDINCILNAALENFKKAGGKNGTGEMPLPEPLTLCVGDTFPAVVTHVESPEEFIFQKLDNMSAIQELQVSLREHCMQTAASEDFRPAPGAVCCSQFTEDNQWYRAVVRGYSSEDRVCVGYIDYGNSEDLEVNRLRPADAALLKLPMQAIPCALAGIKPVSEVWDSEAVQLMKTIVSNKFLKAKIIGKKDIKALVELADECSDPQTNVAHMMVEMGYALSEEKMETKTDVTSDTQDSIGAVPPVEKLEWTSAELPNNRTVDVVVTVTNSPREFYCQLYNVEDLHRLSELSADLSRYCPTANATFTPVVAEPCCAIFPGDGAWYRGMVQDVSPNGKAVVFFGDYGNTSEVAVDKLCPILPKYLKLPFQAVKCWLAGDERMPREWTKDASRRFQQLTAAVQLQAKVLCTSERGSGIELLRDGQSIGDILTAEEMSICKTTTVSAPPVTTAAPIPEPRGGFPKDWKTVVLPTSDTFQLHIAVVRSPSLFYAFTADQPVEVDKLRALMMDLADHCNKQDPNCGLKPEAGAACCAQFSGDKNWYRAIVLEATDSEATVVYADYGNTEKVPFSRILPITRKHLELPFHTIQCRLSGLELLPEEWPSSAMKVFESLLGGKVLASVRESEGNTHTVDLTSCTESREVNVTWMMLTYFRSEQKEAKSDVCEPNTQVEEMPKPRSSSVALEFQPTRENKCCCLDLKEKIDKIEELLLMLVNKFVDVQRNS